MAEKYDIEDESWGEAKRIIKALYQLDRFANANEVSEVSGVSWATAKTLLARLHIKFKILEVKTINGIKYYQIKEE